MAAYKNLSYNTHLSGSDDQVQDPALRAEKFSKEIKYGAIKLHVGNENPIMDPTKFSKNHGENWREQLQATANFTNIIMDVAEARINDGLLDHDEKKVEQGRILLEASTGAALTFRDEVEFSQHMTQVQEQLLWKKPGEEEDNDDYVPDGFQDDDNTREYLRALTSLIPEELHSPQTTNQLTEAMEDIIESWQEREDEKAQMRTPIMKNLASPTHVLR